MSDPRDCRTHTQEMDVYLDGHELNEHGQYEKIVLETVHGLKQTISVKKDAQMYKFFTTEELECKETQQCNMDDLFMQKLIDLRQHFGKPIHISSGYRSREHSAELRKGKGKNNGPHTYGKAVDIIVRGGDAHEIVRLAMWLGFTGIGVAQSGYSRFIHLDMCGDYEGKSRPALWSY